MAVERDPGVLMAGEEEGGPPGSPRRGEQGGETVQCDDWILASITGWVQGGRPKDDIVEKVMTSFDLRELRTATSRLMSAGWVTPNITVPQESAVDYRRRLAEVAVLGLTSIHNTTPLTVQFWVSSAELHKVPGVGPFPDQLSPPTVSIRLGDVDTKLQEVLDRLTVAERLENTVAGLAGTVTKLQEDLKKQQEELVKKTQEIPAARSYADTLRNQAHLRGGRDRSESTKRGRGESDGSSREHKQRRLGERESRWDQRVGREPLNSALSQSLADARREGEVIQERRSQGQGEISFSLVERRRKNRVIQKGTSQVQAEGGAKPPFSIFLSGTRPDCTEDEVKEKLLLCAAAVGGEQEQGVELQGLKVDHIPLKIPNGEAPRSRCWKVTVPNQFAEYMSKSEAYPASWGWRKWNKGQHGGRGYQGERNISERRNSE